MAITSTRVAGSTGFGKWIWNPAERGAGVVLHGMTCQGNAGMSYPNSSRALLLLRISENPSSPGIARSLDQQFRPHVARVSSAWGPNRYPHLRPECPSKVAEHFQRGFVIVDYQQAQPGRTAVIPLRATRGWDGLSVPGREE